MDKLKNMISPGHASDEQKLYGADGSKTSHSGAPTSPGQVNPGSSNVTGNTSEFQDIGPNARNMGGHTSMPGGFDDEPSNASGFTGHSNPAHATANPSTHSGGTSHSTATPGYGSGHSSVAPGSLSGTHDTASTTSIKSGIPGNTTSTHPSGGFMPSAGTGHSGSHGVSNDPYSTYPSKVSESTASPTSGSRIEDPPFSNRTMHGSSPRGPTTGHHGTEGLTGAGTTTGLGAAAHEANKHHGSHPTHTSPASHGLSSTDAPLSSRTTPGSGTINPVASTGGASTYPSTSSSHHSTGGVPGTSSHPSTGSSHHPTTGTTSTSSALADRSRPHADVAGSSVERSFPLGGHAGEGPHALTTANRLDPHIQSSEQEFRHGTHQHGDTSTGGIGGAGLTGARHHQGNVMHPSGTDPTSTTSGVRPSGAYGSDASHIPSSTSHGHHPARDAAVAAMGGTGSHATDSRHGTHSGGVGQFGGQTYNTLSDGTPSGISTRDPAYSSTVPGTTGTGSGTHGSGHLGRDAALATGAGGLSSAATHQGSHHHGTPERTTMTSGGLGQSSGHQYNTLSDGTPSGISSRDPTHSSGIPSTTTHPSGSHGTSHLGRDAAIGTGAAGLGGTSAHEASRHHATPERTSMTSGGIGQPAGQKYNTLGDGTPSGISSRDPAHPQHSSHVPGTSSTRADPTTATHGGHGTSSHHPGRDAGIAATGVGAGGLATHEHGRHHESPSAGIPRAAEDRSAGGALNHRPVPGYDGPQGIPGEYGTGPSTTSTAANRAQGSLSRYPEESTHHGVSQTPHTSGSQPHHGRDAATIGATGGAGTAAAYEAEKHNHRKETSSSPSSAKHDSKHDHHHDSSRVSSEEKKPGLLDKILHPNKSKEHEREIEEERRHGTVGGATGIPAHEAKHYDSKGGVVPTTSDSNKHHHTGEKAALGGTGAGIAGSETYKHGDPTHTKDRTAGMPGSGVHGTEPVAHGQTGHTRTEAPIGQATTSDRTHGLTSGTTGSTTHGHSARMGTDGPIGHGNVPTGHDSTRSHPSGGYDGANTAGAGAAGLGGAAYGADRHAQHGSTGQHGLGSSTHHTPGSSAPTHTTTATPSTQRTTGGIDPRVDNPQYGSSRGANPSSASSVPIGATTQGYSGPHGTYHPQAQHSSRDAGYTGSTVSPSSTNKGYTSKMQEDPVMVGSTSAQGTRNAPTYTDDSPSSATSGEKPGLMDKLLHRDSPNKLHKEPK